MYILKEGVERFDGDSSILAEMVDSLNILPVHDVGLRCVELLGAHSRHGKKGIKNKLKNQKYF